MVNIHEAAFQQAIYKVICICFVQINIGLFKRIQTSHRIIKSRRDVCINKAAAQNTLKPWDIFRSTLMLNLPVIISIS